MNYIRAIDEIFKKYDGPKFAIRFWDKKEQYYGLGDSITFSLVIGDLDTLRLMLSQGSIGFGEAYMDGRLKIEGSFESYLRLRHQFKMGKPSLYLVLMKLLSKFAVPQKRKEQIAYHYDTGNTFFKRFLDSETMSYSAGKYDKGYERLATAQKNKLALICEWLGLPQSASVLDLGSGWGGFALYAAKHHKWHIKGYTLSDAQLQYCQLIKEEKLQDLISIEERDMVVDLPREKFDGITMIESIEHVGQKNILPFFHNVRKILNKDGSFIIQSTIRCTMRSVDRWTLKYVFPGGYLPTKEELINAARSAGFIVVDSIENTQDYVYTINEWIKNLEQNREAIEKEFDPRFYRLWELWMYGTKVSFECGAIGLLRLHLKSYQHYSDL
jgi:cyclopropane-fatty-acyl-phospholipid synthase